METFFIIHDQKSSYRTPLPSAEITDRCCAEFCSLPDYAPLVLVGLGLCVGEGLGLGVGLGLGNQAVTLRESNKGVHNLAGVQNSAQHRGHRTTKAL